MRRGKERKQPDNMKAEQSVSGPDPIILDFCLKTEIFKVGNDLIY